MENLHHNHAISKIFDLKGSMRSRYVQSTGKVGDVLLDENLIEYICSSPLYLRDHSKHVRATLCVTYSTWMVDLAQRDVVPLFLCVPCPF